LALLGPYSLLPRYVRALGRASSLQTPRQSLLPSPEALAGREAVMTASFCSPAWYHPRFAAVEVSGAPCSCLLGCSMLMSACRRPSELPRNLPTGVKNGTKLLRLKISKKHTQQQPSQHAAETATSTAVGSSSSCSTQQPPPSFLYSAQVSKLVWG
jgi:hypothetical protein